MKWLNDYRIRFMLFGFITAIMLGCLEFANGATIAIGPGTDYDFNTIQAGIDTAVDGDTVMVWPGEYIITEPISFRGKAITVQSEAGPDETTIRMGTPADTNRGSVVVFENGETTASILEGFTITGGSGSWLQDSLRGGGIFFKGASATVNNCAIVQNSARRAGGILCDQSSSPRLTNCIIAKNSSMSSGGGISVYSGSSLSLTNCIIRENSSAGSLGGGVVCWGSCLLTLTDCTITGNSGTNGGGIYCGLNSSATMTNCIIRGNSAIGSTPHVSGYSGGVQCYDNSVMNLANCTIAENSAGLAGGAMFCKDSSVTVTNCIMFGNRAVGGNGGAIESTSCTTTLANCVIVGNSAGEPGGAVLCWQGSVNIISSIVRANIAPQGSEISVMNGGILSLNYSNVAEGQAGIHLQSSGILDWGDGNIDADPCFSDPDNDNYHLMSQAGRWDPNNQSWVQDAVTSPCIDAGDPMSPIGLEPFPNGGFVNMGAYGGTPDASKSYFGAPPCETIVAGDINGDGQVNMADLEIMALHWTDEEPLPLP